MSTGSVARTPVTFFSDRVSGLRRLIASSSSAAPVEAAKSAKTTLSYHGAREIIACRKSWTGISAQLMEIHGDGPLTVDLTSDSTRLSVVLEEVGGRLHFRDTCLGVQSSAHELPLSLIPAHLNAVAHATHVRFLRHLVLEFDRPSLVRMFGNEIDPARTFMTMFMFSDLGIMHLAKIFADECARDEPHSLLYGDTLSLALLIGLARLTPFKSQPLRPGALAPWQLSRVTEYLEAHLADDLQLQTISDLVNLSRSYFSRAFKNSTGLAPHKWILLARIAKAKVLLLDSHLPLAHIAVKVGFADQAHFTRAFRRAVGQSPGAWQRARRACTDIVRD